MPLIGEIGGIRGVFLFFEEGFAGSGIQDSRSDDVVPFGKL